MSFACFIEANSFLCKYFVHRLIPLRPTCQLYLPCARCSCFVVCSHIHHWGHANKAALPRAAVLIYLAASARMRIPGWLHRVRAPQGARNDDRDDEDVEVQHCFATTSGTHSPLAPGNVRGAEGRRAPTRHECPSLGGGLRKVVHTAPTQPRGFLSLQLHDLTRCQNGELLFAGCHLPQSLEAPSPAPTTPQI